MKFTGNVYAMREGEIAFPNQPIIIIEGPLVEAQVLETPMLCIMNHQMAVATKASRGSDIRSKGCNYCRLQFHLKHTYRSNI